MARKRVLLGMLFGFIVTLPPAEANEIADIRKVVKCQKRIAGAGATYARKIIKYTLKCTTEVAECEIQCEEGVFGPPCSSNPPPCCDPEDPESNESYGQCLDRAQDICDQQTIKIQNAEASKQSRIIGGCSPLTEDELCGAETPGLNFETLNAGCLALDPGYVCNLTNLVNCVGGPMQRSFLDQIAFVLGPRAGDAVALGHLELEFPDIPIPRRVRGEIAEGMMDVYALEGTAGDKIRVRVRTRDDNGDGTSNLSPVLTLIGVDGTTPVDDTNVVGTQCSVPNVCGSPCQQFERTLPFSGVFTLAVQAAGGLGCPGGAYTLVVVSPGGLTPVLVQNDVPGGSWAGAVLNGPGGALD